MSAQLPKPRPWLNASLNWHRREPVTLSVEVWSWLIPCCNQLTIFGTARLAPTSDPEESSSICTPPLHGLGGSRQQNLTGCSLKTSGGSTCSTSGGPSWRGGTRQPRGGSKSRKHASVRRSARIVRPPSPLTSPSSSPR